MYVRVSYIYIYICSKYMVYIYIYGILYLLNCFNKFCVSNNAFSFSSNCNCNTAFSFSTSVAILSTSDKRVSNEPGSIFPVDGSSGANFFASSPSLL